MSPSQDTSERSEGNFSIVNILPKRRTARAATLTVETIITASTATVTTSATTTLTNVRTNPKRKSDVKCHEILWCLANYPKKAISLPNLKKEISSI